MELCSSVNWICINVSRKFDKFVQEKLKTWNKSFDWFDFIWILESIWKSTKFGRRMQWCQPFVILNVNIGTVFD